MIPLAWLKLVPWRLLGVGAAAVAILLLGWRINSWREAYKALPAAQEALLDEQECNEGSRCAQRVLAFQARQDAFNREVADAYARQIDEIANRPVPTVPVRLCRPARQGGVPGAKPPGASDGGTSAGELPVEVGRDIAIELYRLADDADREALKLKWLQDWNRGLSVERETPAE